MSVVDSPSGGLSADTSLINPEFIQRLQEQRVLHKREVTFHLAQVEKHGAADEALASMIQAAEKIVAIMSPAPTTAVETPDETMTETVRGSPGWAAGVAVVGKVAEPPAYNELPTTHGLQDPMSDDRTGRSGNAWRDRLLGSRA
jgi:hypothetical protein